jgi:Mg-chelatase subunit ChlD
MTSIFNRRSVRGYELRHGIEGFAHQTAAALGLPGVRVEWQPISTAAINQHGRMILSAVKDDAVITHRTIVRYTGFVVHELLHRKYTDFLARDNRPFVNALHNALEDAWIERRAIDAALTGNIRAVLTDLVGQIVDESMDKVKDWADPAIYPFALAVYARGYGLNTPLAQGLEPIFAEASRRLSSAKNSSDTLEIARWVFEQLQLPEDKPEDKPEESKGEGEGKGQADGQGKGEKGEGQADGQADGQGKQGQGEGQADGKKGQGKGQPGARKVPGASTEAMEVEPSINLDPGEAGTFWDGSGATAPGAHLGAEARELDSNVPGRLRHEVRRLFENTGSTLFTRNRKSGSINVHALPRHSLTDRVFQQRRDIEGVDSAVVVLLDVSGSMRRNLNTVASVGAVLAETLNAAGVQTAIISFGSKASMVTDFGTPVAKVKQAMRRLWLGGDTNDYAAVRMASDLLLPRPEQRKVMFVITDGVGKKSDCAEQIRAATALGITVIGIGIQYDITDVYPNAIFISKMEDFGKVVFNQIKLAA